MIKHGDCLDVMRGGDLVILGRCDAVLLTPGWESSRGTLGEVEHADLLGIPVFSTLTQLIRWSDNKQGAP